jgi:O-antigen/teichoic acid export membrane protein
LSDPSPIIANVTIRASQSSGGFAAKISGNILASLARVLMVSAVALVLPAYLTHHLPVKTYAAWILILQLGAYVSYLDLGIQTAVSKFVAEYEAKGDDEGASRHASAGLALMLSAGILGLFLTFVLAWQVPRLFSAMPTNLYQDVRTGVLLVGTSLSFGLVCAVYSSVFLGLQRYWIPMSILIVNRASFAVAVIAVVALGGNLAKMGIAVATVNIATGLLQVVAWKQRAAHIRVALDCIDWRTLKSMAGYCALQSVWMAGMLCVTGFDITIVGHYDYGQTAYYSIATLPTAFAMSVVGAMLGPLIPASSALSTHRTPAEMGVFLARATRYSTVMLLLTGLPFMVCGWQILRWWVGPAYASQTVPYLRVLVLANVIRSLCAPYSAMVVGTGRQGAATATVISEAIVNLGSSVYLARHIGAIGVGMGTFLGSFVSVGLHFAITMHCTRQAFAISRSRLFLNGLLQPSMVAIPSLLLFAWGGLRPDINLRVGMEMAWGLSTLLLAWFGGVTAADRRGIVAWAARRLVASPGSA